MSGTLFRLDGDVAIVTGAGAGIGHAISALLADAGAHVVVVDRDAALAQYTCSIIESQGGSGVAVTADVSDPDAASEVIGAACNAFGKIDILVNNAGIYPPFPRLPDVDWDIFDRTMDVNVKAVLRCTSEAARRMTPGGRIINMSSMESIRPSGPSSSTYNISKGAVNAMTRAAAVDLAPLGIRVNAILPGFILTEGTSGMPEPALELFAKRAPSGRVGKPEDIAAAALFLASKASDYINGHCMVVDGGTTISA